ncbi:unnamed protein product [Calicophoron daubneyi]|uniref:Secreted protein n=1 Tax=Calicophoron daubneyi TaxID=300641 RepID=A0AAV2T3Z2_CALDB
MQPAHILFVSHLFCPVCFSIAVENGGNANESFYFGHFIKKQFLSGIFLFSTGLLIGNCHSFTSQHLTRFVNQVVHHVTFPATTRIHLLPALYCELCKRFMTGK